MKKLIPLLLAISCFVACGQKRQVPESLADIKAVVIHLDSAVTSMYGWEPRDSTYNTAVDTLVADIMSQYPPKDGEQREPDYSTPAIQQQAYDDAGVTWAAFKKLCDEDKYKEALDFYLADKPNNGGKNAGDFLVFFKHSTQRYTFLSAVLLPLMREFKGDDFALKHYIDDLQLEKAMEDFSIALNEETSGYVPEAYPAMVMDLGYALLADGRMEEAQNLFGDIVNAVYGLTGDALYANFLGTKYAAHLYVKDNKDDWALETWENFKEYLNENKTDYSEEELTAVYNKIQDEIEIILAQN